MNKTPNNSLLNYLLFPGIIMLLGWGLRGYIGGGPFGAMIPGAMVALAISILLGFNPKFTSIVVIFGVVGVGLGGEVTYGQTLGFLRDPETVWWGNLGTTVKGAVWGLGGGAILALGLIHNKIPRKTILRAFVFLMIGLFVGFKLINDPKLIYFSDPVNKPRPESWGGLLFGAIGLISYLKFSIKKNDFTIIMRFAKWGLISGGLGFGLGGLWLVLGSQLPDVMFKSWWKMMEFSFGLLFGMGLGYAAWKSRTELVVNNNEENNSNELAIIPELGLIVLISLTVYLVFPAVMEPLAEKMALEKGMLPTIAGEAFRILVNYAFYGFIMILIVLYKNALAWQIGITLTFCHTAVDLMRDLRTQPDIPVNPWIQLIVVILLTLVVAYLVARFRHGKNVNNSMVQILIWSTMTIAIASISFDLLLEGGLNETGMVYLIVRIFFVHMVFLAAAIYASRKSWIFTNASLAN